ncbi:Probable oxidoreductase EphD [Seminavis robusta]|uniref:Probable oxidoreductase EphD n=1 Tax=Seminavis robusta TaxID=568900 RepID=A0A9N8F021_9STRA|nr:Probable oxidoreductase EphD [Seminavis robusta]|eukprot:Sro2161_g317120.1 Probable oxidoreductase EphD (316) ;mRNA; r:8917-10080
MADASSISCSSLIKAGNTAVVTGASSGIGRAACFEFSKAGMNVFMADIDEEELKAAQELVKLTSTNANAKIAIQVVDVADAAAVESFAEAVFADGGKCHILMNNAGIGQGGGAMTDMSTVQKVMNVNTYGPMHGCVAFVPKMKASGEPGIIVNTGSKQGITMPPGNLTYNVSKAALKAYTEGLEHELMKARIDEGGRLRAALLIPGWVNTSIVLKSMRSAALAKGDAFDVNSVFFHEDKPAGGAWMPKQVVDFMIAELDKGRFYIVCPDNDVDRETDNLRMTWTMQDITQDRAPLSRWHPDYKDKFTEYVAANKK